MSRKIMSAVLSLAAILGFPSLAAPKSELWNYWSPSDQSSAKTVSHDAWDGFLKRHIKEKDGINLLGYGSVTADDKMALKDYIKELADVRVRSLNRDEQLAYWVNIYNALTVDLILDNYPVASIRDVSTGLFSGGPWSDEIVFIEGENLTLNDIEHRILRPIWKDPRLHYAVNCASIGCPNLATDAFTAANAEELLEAGARAYVNHPRGAFVSSGSLRVSSIYEWFQEDFGGSDTGVLEHLRKYAEGSLAAELGSIKSIGDDTYDWNLNEAG